jgi:two-component system response regulator HydG
MQFPPNRVLYVEDDEDVSLMMKTLLGQWNYEVALAGTTIDALHLLQSQRFDLCLLDTSLPDKSGFELCEQICELSAHPPVVFVSGHVFATDKARGLQAGALAYLTKPLDFDLLKETMARLVDETSSENSGAARPRAMVSVTS